MQSQHLQNKDYGEINVIKYIVTIKKRFHTILKITVVAFAIAVIIALFFSPSKQYKGKTTILLGTIQKEAIQTQEDVSDFLTALYPYVNVEKGKGLNVLIFNMEGRDFEEVKKELSRASSSVLTQHESIIHKKQTLLDEQINEQIKTLTVDLTENNERIALFNAMVNRLSPYDQAQALSLQAYLASYNNALLLKDSLEKDIQKLEQQKKHEYEKTKILTPPVISQSSTPRNIMVSGVAGIILGILLGIVWIFAKQWWDGNKYLFK